MKILSQIIKLIYPLRCPVCGDYLKEEAMLCKRCLDGLKRLEPPFCSVCGVPFSGSGNSHLCEDCLRKRPVFSSIFSPYLYQDTAMRAVQLFKFQKKMLVGKTMGILLGRFALNIWDKKELKEHVIVPVPLGKRRLRQRGFNQSLVLARYVSKAIGLPLDYLSLRRIKETEPQSLLKKDKRKKNVKGAFQVLGDRLKRKNIILVDDVVTTGSTLNECALALKRAGAKQIVCLVFARAK